MDCKVKITVLWVLKKISKVRDFLVKGIRWENVNGKNINLIDYWKFYRNFK